MPNSPQCSSWLTLWPHSACAPQPPVAPTHAVLPGALSCPLCQPAACEVAVQATHGCTPTSRQTVPPISDWAAAFGSTCTPLRPHLTSTTHTVLDHVHWPARCGQGTGDKLVRQATRVPMCELDGQDSRPSQVLHSCQARGRAAGWGGCTTSTSRITSPAYSLQDSP
jgi:hypothetical protein